MKNMSKKKKIILAIAAAVLIVLIAAVGAFFYYTSKLNIELIGGQEGKSYYDLLKADKDADGVTNILVIGADNDVGSGMDSPGNGDGLVIVSINNTKKQITLTSLMRDIRVVKPSNGYATKLTLAYHDGGPELLIECIEANMGIDIDNYVRVNYHDVVKIIDASGGIKVDLVEEEIKYMNDKIEAVAKTVGADWIGNKIPEGTTGPYKLNGVQAAGYMRVRVLEGDGDLGRTFRIRTVLMGVKDNVRRMGLIRLGNFANVVLPCITTDMQQDDIAMHLVKLSKYLKYDFVSNRIPADDTFYYSNDGHAYTMVDFEANREIFLNTVYTERQKDKILAGEEAED